MRTLEAVLPASGAAPAPKIPPGPKGWPIIGNLPRRLKYPLSFYLDLSLKYGPVVQTKIGHWTVYSISDPDGIKRVMLDNQENYPKGGVYERLKPVLGEGMMAVSGEPWKRQRKLAQPLFHRHCVIGLVDEMKSSISRMLNRWETFDEGHPFDISAEMHRLTLSIGTRLFLGLDLSDEADQVRRALSIIHAEGNRRIFSVFRLREYLPTRTQREVRWALSTVDSLIYRIIDERSANPGEHRDLLSMMMNEKDDVTGQGPSRTQLRDEVMNLFLAGHETSANALSWTWLLMLQHPSVYERVRSEVRSVLGAEEIRYEHLSELRYTQQALEESLRLRPPAWTFSRSTLKDDVICGFKIDAGSIIAINPYMMHHHPDFWKNPEAYNPDRFAEEEAKRMHKFVYFPFGGGPRICIGKDFAMTELMLTLAMVIQKHDMLLCPGQAPRQKANMTLSPDPGVLVTLGAAIRSCK